MPAAKLNWKRCKRMAGALKIPVALFFGIYRGGIRYDIYFEKLTDRVDLSPPGRDEHIHAWVQKYVDRLEHHARSAPFIWFNFYDFWDDRSWSKCPEFFIGA